jgi:hypothetical protein
MCSEVLECFGPMKTPALGGDFDSGSSFGLYANGHVYHNGELLQSLHKENALIMTAGTVINCEFDSDAEGGILRIFEENNALLYEFKDVFEKLGGSEVFPCVCMCPLDPPAANATASSSVDKYSIDAVPTALDPAVNSSLKYPCVTIVLQPVDDDAAADADASSAECPESAVSGMDMGSTEAPTGPAALEKVK